MAPRVKRVIALVARWADDPQSIEVTPMAIAANLYECISLARDARVKRLLRSAADAVDDGMGPDAVAGELYAALQALEARRSGR